MKTGTAAKNYQHKKISKQ